MNYLEELKKPRPFLEYEWQMPSPIQLAREKLAAEYHCSVDHVFLTSLRYNEQGHPLMEFEVFPAR